MNWHLRCYFVTICFLPQQVDLCFQLHLLERICFGFVCLFGVRDFLLLFVCLQISFLKISMWNSAGKLSYSWSRDVGCLKRAFPFNFCVVLHPQSIPVKSELQENLWQPARLLTLSLLCPCLFMHMTHMCTYTSCFDKVEKMVWTHPFQCGVSRHIQTTVNISWNLSSCFTWSGNHLHKLFWLGCGKIAAWWYVSDHNLRTFLGSTVPSGLWHWSVSACISSKLWTPSLASIHSHYWF